MSADESQRLARQSLFRMLSTAPQDYAREAVQLTVGQWEWIERVANDHRLLPMLHWIACKQGQIDWPAPLAAKAARHFAISSRRSLFWRSAMVTVSRKLSEREIPHTYLKGAALFLNTYPDPGMRPLRDLDILVPCDRAVDAHSALLALGYESHPGSISNSIAEGYALPALQHPSQNVLIELHHNLCDPEVFDARPLAKMTLETAKSVRLADTSVWVAAPKALCAHLVLHAGIKSQFNSGPLVLSDLAFLIDRHGTDLKGIKQLAEGQGLARSFRLISHLLESHGGPALWQGMDEVALDGPTSGHAEQAAKLLVQPMEAMRTRMIGQTIMGPDHLMAKVAMLMQKALRPVRWSVAPALGTQSKSNIVWASYPSWALDRFRRLLGVLVSRRLRADLELEKKLNTWLLHKK